MLTTNNSTSFDIMKQSVAAFLDTIMFSLCGVMLEKELLLGIVRFMWSLLWCKTLVVYVEGAECMTLTGYKGLPQGSVLYIFAHFCTTFSDLVFAPSGCDLLQYADDTRHTTYFKLLVPWFRRPARPSAFSFRCLVSRYPLQSRRSYYSLGSTCGFRSRSRLLTECRHKW
jgi:hypothetical protein